MGATIIDQKVCVVPWGGSEEAVNCWKKQMIKFEGIEGVFSSTYLFFNVLVCEWTIFK